MKLLRKLQPRLYSIASSQKVASRGGAPDDRRGALRKSHGRERKGVASTYLAERVGDDGRVPVFVHTAKAFPPAGGRRDADHHGWPGHRRRAVSRLSCRSGKPPARRAKTGSSSASSGETSDFLYERGIRANAGGGRAQPVRHGVLPRPGATRFTCRIGCGKRPRRSGVARAKARNSSSAATARAWPRMWTPSCTRSSKREGGKTPEEAAEYVEELKKDEALQARRLLNRLLDPVEIIRQSIVQP